MNPLEHICGFDQTVPAAASEASFSQFAVNAASAAAASARAAPLLPKYTSRKITAASRSLQQVVPMPVPSHDGDKRSGAAAILHCLATAMNATIISHASIHQRTPAQCFTPGSVAGATSPAIRHQAKVRRTAKRA
eukprot:CAMPEP_0172804492 /NCGR_PEP_ID=MMETSP1075-20121228/5201_1 /TAXON_ID=2916 /ORGANISM="Ceratium fusus, Strain PA161109" /LENGTH=134 /DNA_ID=CAMNT_0013643073 /DNA_START=221 /DNA_END=621 /DNA_ORIENTATION=-